MAPSRGVWSSAEFLSCARAQARQSDAPRRPLLQPRWRFRRLGGCGCGRPRACEAALGSGHGVGRTAGRSVGRSDAARLAGARTVGRSLGRSGDRAFGRTGVRVAGRTVGGAVARLTVGWPGAWAGVPAVGQLDGPAWLFLQRFAHRWSCRACRLTPGCGSEHARLQWRLRLSRHLSNMSRVAGCADPPMNTASRRVP